MSGPDDAPEDNPTMTRSGRSAERSPKDAGERANTAPLASRYEILGELGSGGMGVVYKARDLETGEVVALKLLKPGVASDPEVVDRFKRELRLARKVAHRHVARIYEFNRANGTAYISIE